MESDGKEQRFTVRYLAVYAKAGGRWRMVAWQSTRVPRTPEFRSPSGSRANDDRALVVLAHALGPHLVSDGGIVARNEV